MPLLRLIALLCVLLVAPVRADTLPAQARIVYSAKLSGLTVGEAVQSWRVSEGRYRLTTELNPIIGPRIRYESQGLLTDAGLKPQDYAEYRNRDETPRHLARFEWARKLVVQGAPDRLQQHKLDTGAQELNALPFHLAFLGAARTAHVQVATGRKLRNDRFTQAGMQTVSLKGQQVDARVWRSESGDDRTEFWLAPGHANLPVRILRQDDKGELQLIAQTIEFQQE
ncbi:DUF3108 domain-containing protein [Chitinimonas sp. BJYL2]|uniref:DUF3108 domain-containing protein n=1 Tax=Chitinimonas sp. BJYL2 TaxID=2976696 RepID=UPI0022B31E95|nr:DUF3108 domain-containing protein [Chitinimonas sp. BJYL2]